MKVRTTITMGSFIWLETIQIQTFRIIATNRVRIMTFATIQMRHFFFSALKDIHNLYLILYWFMSCNKIYRLRTLWTPAYNSFASISDIIVKIKRKIIIAPPEKLGKFNLKMSRVDLSIGFCPTRFLTTQSEIANLINFPHFWSILTPK